MTFGLGNSLAVVNRRKLKRRELAKPFIEETQSAILFV